MMDTLGLFLGVIEAGAGIAFLIQGILMILRVFNG